MSLSSKFILSMSVITMQFYIYLVESLFSKCFGCVWFLKKLRKGKKMGIREESRRKGVKKKKITKKGKREKYICLVRKLRKI